MEGINAVTPEMLKNILRSLIKGTKMCCLEQGVTSNTYCRNLFAFMHLLSFFPKIYSFFNVLIFTGFKINETVCMPFLARYI